MEIDKLQLDLEILYMNNLLKQAKKNKIDQTPITDRIKELEYNITDSISNTDTEKDIIYSDDYIYKKTYKRKKKKRVKRLLSLLLKKTKSYNLS